MTDAKSLGLMCILAHPDDESMGAGGILARYASEGIRTSVVTATGGERGWFGDPDAYPGPEALAATRYAELEAACQVLDVARLIRLGHRDAELDTVEVDLLVRQLAEAIRSERPQVVITFDPFGSYGHPDHVAICQATHAAVINAALTAYEAHGSPHRISKLYYMADTEPLLLRHQSLFGELVMEIDGVERRPVGWPAWAITTHVDTRDYASRVWEAIACHRTQLPAYESLANLDPDEREQLWESATFFRVLSFVNGEARNETDLFAGLR